MKRFGSLRNAAAVLVLCGLVAAAVAVASAQAAPSKKNFTVQVAVTKPTSGPVNAQNFTIMLANDGSRAKPPVCGASPGLRGRHREHDTIWLDGHARRQRGPASLGGPERRSGAPTFDDRVGSHSVTDAAHELLERDVVGFREAVERLQRDEQLVHDAEGRIGSDPPWQLHDRDAG